MQQAWYILNYHDISWEENPLIRGIGGTFSPDIFQSHVDEISKAGRIVSVQEGFDLFKSNSIAEPLFSFWFDDGFRGVRKYAFPILETQGTTAALSVNSQFTLRREMFWRCKLAYLNHVDGMRFLRGKIRQLVSELDARTDFSPASSSLFSMKRFALDEFSKEIVTAIDDVYNDFTNEHFRDDAFRIFDDFEGIRFLQQNGWEITNHSCSHYPVAEDSHINHFSSDFETCEAAIRQNLGISTRYWVVPFDRASKRSKHIFTIFEQADDQNRHLVFVGNKSNLNPQIRHRALYRIGVPEITGSALVRYLKNIRPFGQAAKRRHRRG